MRLHPRGLNMFTYRGGPKALAGSYSDKAVKYTLMAIAFAAVLILIAVTVFIAGNSFTAISEIDLVRIFTDAEWKPSDGLYGAGSIILGSLLVTLGAMVFAIPVGVGSAIFMSEVAPEKVRNILRPVIELFAGIPSVVFGFFGLMVIVPALADLFPDQTPTGFSWLAASILLGFMALPTIISVSQDALEAVPRSYREASLAMGSTRWETTSKIVVPAAMSGILSAIILGIGRAIGETMAVMMVTGNAALVPEPLWNVFSFVRTITSTLALEMPEVVVGSTHYSALFLLGLILMIVTLCISLVAKHAVRAMVEKSCRGDSTSRLVKLAGEDRMPFLKNAVCISFVAVAVCMACVLFMPWGQAAIVAVAAAVFTLVIGCVSRRISRVFRQRIMHTFLLASVLLCVGVLAVMIGDIVIKAMPALSLDFITDFPSDAGRSGGIYPAIIGTLKLIAGTAVISLPIGILTGTYLAEYSKRGRFTSAVEYSIEILNGTPSIVFALFGLSAIVTILGLGISLLAGCITLAFMILPVIIKTTEDALMNVPREVREASYALGASKRHTTFMVVLPAALGGILTGAILGLGRAAGETAPIMFTAAVLMQYKVGWGVLDPVMALPYHLYYLATEGAADPSMQYATALVLLVIVLSMFLLANVIRKRSNEKNRW